MALFVVALACDYTGAATQPSTEYAMQSDPRADVSAANAGELELREGSTLTLDGGWRIGLKSITSRPLTQAAGSPLVATARVVVAAYAGGIPAEFTLSVREHDLLPAGDGLHRVLRLSPKSAEGRARLVLAAMRNNAASTSRPSIYLADGGSLRLNGPDTHGATDVTIVRWAPDTAKPQAVDIEWIPAQFAREDTDAKDIHNVHLDIGSQLVIGKTALTVAAIEAQAVDHPAWVRFEGAGH